jgi:hypothetical protein
MVAPPGSYLEATRLGDLGALIPGPDDLGFGGDPSF